MNHVYEVVVAVHVVAALNALPSFWIVLCLRKGSPQHRWFGRLFVRSMLAMSATAGLLAAALAWEPARFAPPAGDVVDLAAYCETVRRIASLLVVVALFVSWLVIFGLRALRRRAGRRGSDLAIAVGTLMLGAAAVAAGQLPGWELLDAGGVLLLISGVVHGIRLRRTAPASRLVDHVAGMLGAGTMLHAALAVQVLPRLLPGFEGERMFDAGKPIFVAGLLLTAAACVYYRGRLGRRPPREGPGLLGELAADGLS